VDTASLIADLADWPGPPLARAYEPKDRLWKLSILADLGLTRGDPRIADLAERIFAHQAEDGGFLTGGFDHTRTWDARSYLCIGHVPTHALTVFGYVGDPRLERAFASAIGRQRFDGGWHPNERKHADLETPSCPFGTTNILRALAAHADWRRTEVARRGAEFLLDCWARREEPWRPIGFGVGATWQKLQYPLVQYGLLKVLDTLSGVPGVSHDPRYREMLGLLESKRNPDGSWKAESVTRAYANFDFGQKKAPSRMITVIAERILARS
jgi:hypothetical protein